MPLSPSYNTEENTVETIEKSIEILSDEVKSNVDAKSSNSGNESNSLYEEVDNKTFLSLARSDTFGVALQDDCFNAFQQLKMKRGIKSLVFYLDLENKCNVNASASLLTKIHLDKVLADTTTHEDLLRALRHYDDVQQCRYVVTDFDYNNPTTNQITSKLIFFLWLPAEASIRDKMRYISNKSILLKGLNGVFLELQNTKLEDYEYENILKTVLSKQYTSSAYGV
ncbi:unnamed protein product [Gordionus sp. m RMFG-2023]